MPAIIGAGGGGDKEPRQPVEAPDSLHSTAYARIDDLWSEGEIVGLANGMKSVYFNDTPLENADGTLNFKNVSFEYRLGTQTQDYIAGFPAVENEIAVGVQLLASPAWTQALNNVGIDAVQIRVSTPTLTQSDTTNGDINGSEVSLKFELATDGGAFVELVTDVIKGKTTSKYERSYRFNLPFAATGWIIRVTRLTANSNSAAIQNSTFVESYTEIVDAKLRYPMSAHGASIIDAQQFPSIPRRAFDLIGRIIKVPSNYNAATRVYTGIWDGLFQPAWTDNPAWIVYDLILHKRYGLGHLVEESVPNKWAFYTIAKYCDGFVSAGTPKRATVSSSTGTLGATASGTFTRSTGSFVTDGFLVGDFITTTGFTAAANNGSFEVSAVNVLTLTIVPRTTLVTTASPPAAGKTLTLFGDMEPRFGCNLYLQTQEDAYKVITDMAGVFRGMAYYASAAINPTADMPTDPVFLYTPANVVEGKFTYMGSGKRARHTVALVTWNDQSDFGRQKVEYTEELDGIARYGVNQTDVIAVGCSSRGQARRLGKMILATERLETDVVSFGVGIEGTLAFPGQTIKIADPLRAGRRTGGRVSSATTTSIVVDHMDATTPPAAGNTLSVISAAGTLMERVVSTVNTVTRTITVTVAFTAVPIPGAMWVIDSPTLYTQTFRVVSVGENDDNTYTISALEHEPQKYAYVDADDPIEPRVTVGLTPPVAITGMTVTAFARVVQYVSEMVITVDWLMQEAGAEYEVQWRKDNGAWRTNARQRESIFELRNAFPGVYLFKVTPFNALGIPGPDTYSGIYTLVDMGTAPLFVASMNADIAAALLTAQNAQATADGAIETFWQISMPAIGTGAGQAKIGDIWFDIDDGNKIYRVVGTAWVDAQDDAIALAILAASNAQATADGRVMTFFQSTTPIATAIGDLWFNTTVGIKAMFRWNGLTWEDAVADITLDQLAGNGVNVLWDEYSQFPNSTLPLLSGLNGGLAPTYDAANRAVGTGGSLSVTTQGANIAEGFHLGADANDYNLPLLPGKYIFSVYVRSSVAGHTVKLAARQNHSNIYVSANGGDVAITAANTWQRISGVLDLDPYTTMTAILPFLYTNRSGVVGRTIKWDGFMLEPKFGNLTTPSLYAPGAAGRAVREAQDTANSKTQMFYQTTTPVAVTVGDLWYNMNLMELRRWSGALWVLIPQVAVAAGTNILPNPTFASNVVGAAVNVKLLTNEIGCDGWYCSNGATGTPATTYAKAYLGNLHSRIGDGAIASAASVLPQFRSIVPMPIEPGKKYNAGFNFTASYNATLPASGYTLLMRMIVQWLDDAKAIISTSTLSQVRTPTGALTADITAPTNAKWCYVFLDTIFINSTGATYTPAAGTVVLETIFTSAWMNRKYVLDSDIDDGAIYGRFDILDGYSTGGTRRQGLRFGASGQRLGDQRNMLMTRTGSTGSRWSGAAITYSIPTTGAPAVITINVALGTLQAGSVAVAYNASSGTVSQTRSTTATYYLYYVDAAYAGGAKTLNITTNALNLANADDRAWIGNVTITTPAVGTGGSGGGESGGGCVDGAMWIDTERQAEQIVAGDWIDVVDEASATLSTISAQVLSNRIEIEPCVRLITEGGAQVVASETTPMTLRDGSAANIADMLGLEVAVDQDGVLRWEIVTECLPIGNRPVCYISVGGLSYFAGSRAPYRIATHNAFKP